MANAKDLMNKLGGGGTSAKLTKSLLTKPEDAAGQNNKNAGGKHFDPSQKGHGPKKSGGGSTVPTSVRPKV